jgi:hypothetical protein
MAKERNLSWTKIIPNENLPSLQWCYAQLLPELILLERPFWHPEHERLYRDWQYQSWLQYYENFPQGYFKLICLALDLPEPDLEAESADRIKFALRLFKNLHEQNGTIVSRALQSKEVREFATARLLPLKLSQFVLLNHMTCLVKFGVSVPALITAAREGDQEAMLKLVTVDNIFMEFDSIRHQIRLATLLGKTDFLGSLAKALLKSADNSDLSKYRDEFFMYITWHLGFSQTGVEQFGYFLEACGMKRFRSTSSLQRKLNRLGLSTK